MQEPKIDLSIIVPCHNLEKYISPLLISLNSQFFKQKVEIWFVLDDCTDRTYEVIENEIDKEKYIVHYIHCCVHACGLARNLGLDACSGEYVWFIDGDDWIIGTSAIQTLLRYIKQDNFNILKMKYTSNKFPDGWHMMVWQYIFRRDTISDIRFSNIQPNEDVEFMGKIFEGPCQVNETVDEFYFYNYGREGSNMQQFIKKGKIEP